MYQFLNIQYLTCYLPWYKFYSVHLPNPGSEWFPRELELKKHLCYKRNDCVELLIHWHSSFHQRYNREEACNNAQTFFFTTWPLNCTICYIQRKKIPAFNLDIVVPLVPGSWSGRYFSLGICLGNTHCLQERSWWGQTQGSTGFEKKNKGDWRRGTLELIII